MNVEHGGNMLFLASDWGHDPATCLDFSANINPLGLSSIVQSALVEAFSKLVHYPDVTYQRSKNALVDFHHCDSQQIILSNGAVELFYELARCLKPRNLLLLSPTFMEYEKAFKQEGTRICYHVLSEPDYSWEFQSLLPDLEGLDENDVVLLCNPNNPTGSLVTGDVMFRVAEYLRNRGIVLIVDEAFIDFLGNDDKYSLLPKLDLLPNVIIVRSLTKFYAIPGLRLGYAISKDESLIAKLEEKRPPWTVNALADEVLPVILQDKSYQQRTLDWLISERAFLYEALCRFEALKVTVPSVNYIFFEYKGNEDLRQLLRQKRVFIRSCQDYHHLTVKHYRVAIRTRDENLALLSALEDVLESRGQSYGA